MHKYIFVYLEGCPQCKVLEKLLVKSNTDYVSINIVKFIFGKLTLEERELYKTKSIGTPLLLRIENNNSLKLIDLQNLFKDITSKWNQQ
jgi:hypothetical protein